jgi:uncharacterized protein YdeI (YjbR/CyaY-like superfamily)
LAGAKDWRWSWKMRSDFQEAGMITRIEDYFLDGCGRCARFATDDCSARRWRSGLAELRQICCGTGMIETVKWGHPCYTHAGRNIAVLGAFRDSFRLNFFDAALLDDPDGLLTKQGENTQHASTLLFTGAEQVAARCNAILALLQQAMDNAAAGKRPLRDTSLPEMPAELRAALTADDTLAAAFAALTPGRRKSHILAVGSAKNSSTRAARVARLTARILAGKGATEI